MPVKYTLQPTQTVGGLRAALYGLPDNLPVLLSRDAEGNGFNFIAPDGTSINHWTPPPDKWSDIEVGDTAKPTDSDAAIILWPED